MNEEEEKKHFAVLGGDQRQRQLSRLLRRDGHQVDTWGMEPDDRPEEALALAAPADCVILPLPVTQGEGKLNCPLSRLEPTLVAVLSVAVGLILLSVMLPLLGIMTNIGG